MDSKALVDRFNALVNGPADEKPAQDPKVIAPLAERLRELTYVTVAENGEVVMYPKTGRNPRSPCPVALKDIAEFCEALLTLAEDEEFINAKLAKAAADRRERVAQDAHAPVVRRRVGSGR